MPAGGSDLILLALGKFGGRELNYHSDLDLIFLYVGDGSTFHTRRSRRSGETTTNQHFFSELGQRVIKAANQLGPNGRLYEIDARLRPTGRSGPLATSLDELRRYFAEGQGQLWERQALCKARVVYGSPEAAAKTLAVVAEAAFSKPWQSGNAAEIRAMRQRLQDAATPANIKRGSGGIVDIEFIVQLLQLRHGAEHTSIRLPGTREALMALHDVGVLDREDFMFLASSYQTLRTIECRLRFMNTTAKDDLPEDPLELAKLAAAVELSGWRAVDDGVPGAARGKSSAFRAVFGDVIGWHGRLGCPFRESDKRQCEDVARRSASSNLRRPRELRASNRYATWATELPIPPTLTATHAYLQSAALKESDYTSVAGIMTTLPSPMRPVRATSTILRRISSARASSTHRLISTLGRNASEYSLSLYWSR